jgi:iron complex outermembrane recepter protein
LIIRNPSLALVNQYYASPFLSPTAIRPEQITAIVDDRLQNVGIVNERGIDIAASYTRPIGSESLTVSADVTRLTRYALQQSSLSPSVSLLNTIGSPVRTKAHAGAYYGNADWTIGASANYVGAYLNTGVTPNARIPAWTTFDARSRYAFDVGSLGGPLQVALNVQNVFDRKPPGVANVSGRIGYDPEEASALGRVISLELTKKW